VLVFYEISLSSPSVAVLDREIATALENSPIQIELYISDWPALKPWVLKKENFSLGSIVLNRQLTEWEACKWYIIAAMSLIILEALLIGGLTRQCRIRRNAESAHAITHDRLRLAVEAGRSVGWDWDLKSGQYLWFGDLQNMFGIQSDSYSDRVGDLGRRVHPDDRDFVSKAIDDAIKSRKPYTAEFRVSRKDGTVRWITAMGKFYYASNGDPERMLGLAVDSTERKLAEEALSSVSRRLIQAQEQERLRIARELHDDINQRIAMLSVEADVLQQSPPRSTIELGARLNRLRLRLSEISTEIQAISHRLHSSKLEYLGLVAACKSFCQEVAERHNVTIDFTAEGVPGGLPEEISLCLFRILQEALTNAIKHSEAQRFEAELRGASGEIRLAVRDYGVGFAATEAMNTNGLGLISMRERISFVGGTFSITSKPMGGTEVTVRVPAVVAHSASQPTLGAA
jgi:signal transduction histidine kinase